MSNQKQLALAFNMYATDNSDLLVANGKAGGFWNRVVNGATAPEGQFVHQSYRFPKWQ